jgi:hypothetical protein
MPSFSFRILGLLALATTLPLEAQVSPALSGIVTDVGTPAAFAVNGRQVHCTAKTQSTLVTPSQHAPLAPCPARTVGESLVVYGKRNANLGSIVASIIESEPIGEGKVEGFAVIDRIIRASDGSGATLVSADGNAIGLPAAIHAVFQPPLSADRNHDQPLDSLLGLAAPGRFGDGDRGDVIAEPSEGARGQREHEARV